MIINLYFQARKSLEHSRICHSCKKKNPILQGLAPFIRTFTSRDISMQKLPLEQSSTNREMVLFVFIVWCTFPFAGATRPFGILPAP